MNTPKFEEQLQWITDQGLELDSRIERRKVNGIYGMYATSPIPIGTVLVKLPENVRIPVSKDIKYPDSFPFQSKYAHSAAIQMNKGKSSKYHGFFLNLETLDELKTNSCFFYDEAELDVIKQMNMMLFNSMMSFNNEIRSAVNQIIEFDPSTDKDSLHRILLNLSSRGWGNVGFLPIFELFNHCDLKGITLRDLSEGKERGYIARINYEAGEQVWVSYQKRDMYKFAIAYNYFDPTGSHFIDLGSRVVQQAKTDFEKLVFQHTSKHHRLSYQNTNGVINYQLNEPGVFFLEGAPNLKLINYVRDNCFQSLDELKTGVCSSASFDKKILEFIDYLIHMNNVDNFQLSDIPDNLHRHYFMLKKEMSILNANKKWVITNSENYIIRPDLKTL